MTGRDGKDKSEDTSYSDRKIGRDKDRCGVKAVMQPCILCRLAERSELSLLRDPVLPNRPETILQGDTVYINLEALLTDFPSALKRVRGL